MGWVAKPAKMIDFTSRPTDLLGILFDGVRASYGLSPDKFAGLIARTLQLCEAGSVTMAHLRAILGSWCWALLVRRPAFSVLEHVFGQLDPLARPQRRVKLWRTSVRELLCLVDLAPLLVVAGESGSAVVRHRVRGGRVRGWPRWGAGRGEEGRRPSVRAGGSRVLRACFKQTGKACYVVARFVQDFAAARSEGRHAAASDCGGRGGGG